MFNGDPPDLIFDMEYDLIPNEGTAGQWYSPIVTVKNVSRGDCHAETTDEGAVNLKIRNDSSVVVFDKNKELISLPDGATYTIGFDAIIEIPGIYELIFTIDKYNSTGDAYKANNVLKRTVSIGEK